MSDPLRRPASVAVVPCYNEERNPVDLANSLLSVPNLMVTFFDDASDPASAAILDELAAADSRVTIKRNVTRSGKASSVVAAMAALAADVERVIFVDCDVRVESSSVEAVLDELESADLVLANAKALRSSPSIWERGAIFSANRHDRLRDRFFDRYPARFTNGRLLGMSRRLVQAIVKSDVPRHTEDSHFMLVCLRHGMRYSYRRDALLRYRAPQTMGDYLRQSNRFAEGRELLSARWPEEVLVRYYDLRLADVLSTVAAEALHDPLGALVFGTMLAAKALQPRRARTQGAAWAVASSTKAVR